MRKGLHVFGVLSLLASLFVFTPATSAEPAANDPFLRTWQRTDQPIADGNVTRTWMWGPAAFTGGMSEGYAESPNGKRTVQYFDKSRMEITDPNGDQSSPWYVTNGLLVMELVTGQMQVGNNTFVPRSPAQVNVAGDADDTAGPTYATFAGLRDAAALSEGSPVTQRVDRAGTVSDDGTLAGLGVSAARYVAETDHTVASPFWAFMQSNGIVWENGGTTTAPLFQDPFYATGYPISEAYWATVKVGGTARDVLLQCFERRCLTYTPGNPAEWQVEAGNVGQHYYRWRYPEANPGPNATANALAESVTQAPDDAARKQALMQVFSALNVGVYAGDGTMLLGGAERQAEDFYLYELEVEMLAGAIGRGQTFGIVDLAMQLTAMELLPEGQIFDPETIRQALLGGVAAAEADPSGFGSLSPLIVRQLGLTQSQPYDLFEEIPLETIRLDPLAYFLVLADMTVPLIADKDIEAGATSQMIAHSNGILKASDIQLAAACDPPTMFQGDAFKNAYGWTKISAELLQLIPATVGKVTVVLDALHGAILAFSVGVTELDQRLETHYGHETPGETLTFRVKVEMRDDLTKALIECGWIAGTDFPAKGPIAGVSIHWFWDNLEEHGQIDCGNACPTLGGSGVSIDATGADGIAKLTFRPHTEADPGEGWVVEEQGIVTGVALYQSKFTNLLGSYGQYLTPKSGATRWVVARHEQPGYNVSMTVEYDVHLHDYPTPPMYPHDHDYSASGKVTYELFIPDSAIKSPYVGMPFSQKASGSGQEAIVTIGNGGGGDYQCSAAFNGSWTNYAEVEDDGAKARGDRLRYIRFRTDAPDDDTYTGNCDDYHLWINSYTNAETNPWIDLQATGTTVKEYDPCPTTHSPDITCEGNIKWTIKVEWGGFGN